MQKLDELMRDTTNTLLLYYLKIHFIGSSGIGKSTTRKRLTGRITNLVSLPEGEKMRCSTYLAEFNQVLAMMDVDKLTLKVSENPIEAMQDIFAYVYSSQTDHTFSSPESGHSSHQHSLDASASDQSDPTHPLPSTNEPRAAVAKATSLEAMKKEQVVIPTFVDQVIARFYSIVGSGKYAEQLADKMLLNLVDVGGQPGFLEMLPFLSKGPGMFLAFFPLDKDLDEPCEVSFEREGDKITPYPAIYTIHETLSQILSAISYHVTLDTDLDREFLSKLGDLARVKPVATLVGTFKDKLETKVKTKALQEKLSSEFPQASESAKEEVIKQALGSPSDQPTAKVCADMQSKVNQLLASESLKKEVDSRIDQELKKKNEAISTVTCNFEDLLFHPADDQHFIAVDNFTGTEVDIDPLRKHLQKMFYSFFKGAQLRIRPTQLFLGVILRKEYDIVSMDDCIHIGRKLNMKEEEVRFSVWYLDRWVGALIYHPEIKDDWFKKNIICNPQVVFDSISSLIVKNILEVHCPEGSSRGHGFTAAEKKNWKEKGQFSLDTVKRCHSEENEKKVKQGKLIPVEKLVILLEHSNVLSQIITKKKQGRREIEEVMCFFPAILECASPKELTKLPHLDTDTPSPIKITFESGYVPIGVFCALISRLVSRGSARESILGKKWELVESGVKRNLVSFRVGSAKHEITLVAHVNCYEIRVKPRRGHKDSDIHYICSYTLSTVLYMLKEICRLTDPVVAFDCHCDHHTTSTGLCCLRGEEEDCVFFECDYGEVALTKSQEYWFVKVCCMAKCLSDI